MFYAELASMKALTNLPLGYRTAYPSRFLASSQSEGDRDMVVKMGMVMKSIFYLVI